MQSLPTERKRNQRKSPLTPKKSFRKEDSPPVAMRVGGRVKKAKVPFDPSDAVTKRRQTDSCLSMKRVAVGKDSPVAQYSCFNCKKYDKPENLVNCKAGCSTHIHLNCLQSICENFGKNEEQSWECNSCQSCTVCNKGSSPQKPILKCYNCFAHFHAKCHGSEDKIKIIKENRFCCGICGKHPKRVSTPSRTVTEKPRAFAQRRVKPTGADNKSSGGGFLGFNADEVIETSSSDEDESNDLVQTARVQRPAQNRMPQRHPSGTDDDVSSIDASDWSIEQVFKYFKNIFPRHAHVFKDHEIDGPSLYLLKRGDIVKGFDIKIGPALKIYGHILKLQTKNNDPTLSWH
ncbi:uncharacterized protein LOC119079092 [Bradysia coprophila]|uniref:uncharacterized protein LOC119079092 n=1 Tax=Bradysia coprophila TaxID=38358 RepID=UPI00187D7545|nr:uncharacterized protein LOC119079092 [Bradysia coprophila]